MSKTTFTASSGITCQVRPVPETLAELAKKKVEKDFRERGEAIDPPTYTIKTASGKEIPEPHDESTLQTDEDRALWRAHQAALERLAAAQTEAESKVWLMRGLVFELPEDDTWMDEQEEIGVEVPRDAGKGELKWHYLTTEVLLTVDDMMQAVQAITSCSYAGIVTEEAIGAAMDSFRNRISGTPLGSNPVDPDKPVAALDPPKRSGRGRKTGGSAK